MSPAIFYDPRVHDYGSAIGEGFSRGLAGAAQMQQMAVTQKKLDMQQRIEAANAENAKALEEMQAQLKGMPTIEAISGDANAEVRGATSPAVAERFATGGAEEATGLARTAALKDVEGNKKQREELISKKTALIAGYDKTRYQNYIKHGLPELAEAIQERSVAMAAALGKNVGKKAGLNFLKAGPMGDMVAGVTEDDIEETKDHFEIKEWGPNRDGIVRANKKTGEVEVIREPTPKEEKEDKPPTTRDFQEGRSKVTKQWNPETKTWDELSRGPMDKPESGSKSEAKKEWTKGDVRQEYNNLNTYLNKAEADIANRLEEEGEDTGLKAQLEKIRKIRTGLMKYRSDDMWSVSDPKSSERGKYPRNLQKIEDYLAGFGDQGEQKKDITQEKPTTGKKNRPDLNSYYKTGG